MRRRSSRSLSPLPMEVGISPTHRCTLELARTVRRSAGNAIAFGAKDVILVTGGGRGVTAEAAICLAETYRATLILTGRTPTPTGPRAVSWARRHRRAETAALEGRRRHARSPETTRTNIKAKPW